MEFVNIYPIAEDSMAYVMGDDFDGNFSEHSKIIFPEGTKWVIVGVDENVVILSTQGEEYYFSPEIVKFAFRKVEFGGDGE